LSGGVAVAVTGHGPGPVIPDKGAGRIAVTDDRESAESQQPLGVSLRASIEAALLAEMRGGPAPALGDIVAGAIRDGRRIRRRRRVAGLAAVLVVALAAVGLGAARVGRSPRASAAPAGAGVAVGAAAGTRTWTVRDGTERVDGMQKKATSAAMLHLLTTLLPPGRTSGYGAAADDDLLVQLFLDRGDGPARIRVRVSHAWSPVATGVTVSHTPGDCGRALSVSSARPDGTDVVLDVNACPPAVPVARPALTAAEAVRIAADPRWGLTMDARLVDAGAARFPGGVPVFVS
jgi:hypothetical protein